ncbi:hypothetical protein BDQ17DRAFT_1535647 [Cyathus striatus]|nr:hypothetical protein BDQ17DRAFT_1535647 [Cyathus striatus]
MTSSSTASTLQPHHLKNLLQILQRANFHYSTLAAPRASVDVQKAIHLDHRQVSVVPLPVVEQVISPQASPNHLHNLKCVIPASVPAVVADGRSRCRNTHWRAATSDVSATLLDTQLLSPLELTPIETEDDEHDVTLSGNYDRNFMHLLATYNSELEEPDAPVDEVEDIWELGDSDDDELSSPSSPSLRQFHHSDSESSGSTSGSSQWILTPEHKDNAPLMIRIKRKSAEIRDDTEVFEKRPKFDGRGGCPLLPKDDPRCANPFTNYLQFIQ